MTLSNRRRLELLEKVAGPRHSAIDVEGMRELDLARRLSAALRRATEPHATAETIEAAQRIAERLIGGAGHFSGEVASLLRAVLERAWKTMPRVAFSPW